MTVNCANTRCSAYPNCKVELDCPFYQAEIVKTDKSRKDKQQTIRATEDEVQQAVIEYCELKNIIVVHIPNEAKRSAYYGSKMKKMGLRKGFPDLFFPTARDKYHGLMIELKRDTKSKPTKEQIAWISYLTNQGYCAKVCCGIDEAIKQINKYFGVVE